MHLQTMLPSAALKRQSIRDPTSRETIVRALQALLQDLTNFPPLTGDTLELHKVTANAPLQVR